MSKKRRVLPQNINGVLMPPRKKFNPAQTLVIRFALRGIVPSKKNRQLADRNYKKIVGTFQRFIKENAGRKVTAKLINGLQQQILDIKPYVRPSKKFLAWVDITRPIIIEQAAIWQKKYASKGFTYPITSCSISIYHYWKDDKLRDCDNRLETINDLLVSCGILADDAWQCERAGNFEADLYKDEILEHLHDITVVAYKW